MKVNLYEECASILSVYERAFIRRSVNAKTRSISISLASLTRCFSPSLLFCSACRRRGDLFAKQRHLSWPIVRLDLIFYLPGLLSLRIIIEQDDTLSYFVNSEFIKQNKVEVSLLAVSCLSILRILIITTASTAMLDSTDDGIDDFFVSHSRTQSTSHLLSPDSAMMKPVSFKSDRSTPSPTPSVSSLTTAHSPKSGFSSFLKVNSPNRKASNSPPAEDRFVMTIIRSPSTSSQRPIPPPATTTTSESVASVTTPDDASNSNKFFKSKVTAALNHMKYRQLTSWTLTALEPFFAQVGQWKYVPTFEQMNRRSIFSVKCTMAKKVEWRLLLLFKWRRRRGFSSRIGLWRFSSSTARAVLRTVFDFVLSTDLLLLSKAVRTDDGRTKRRFDYIWLWMGLYDTLCSDVTCSNVTSPDDQSDDFLLFQYSNIR